VSRQIGALRRLQAVRLACPGRGLFGAGTRPARASRPAHNRGRAVKQRMKSVGNIAKITKAMKMVAASRLRGVQTRMEQSRGLPLPFVKLLGDAPGARPPSGRFLQGLLL